MADVHNPEQRSRNMAAIKGSDTKPEMRVRSILHGLGYRYRLHRKDLPGKPDIVLSKHRTVIFVHGCFWHCHDCRWGSVIPKTRAEFWSEKRGGNVIRDEKHGTALKRAGWKVITIWECETRTREDIWDALSEAGILSFGTYRTVGSGRLAQTANSRAIDMRLAPTKPHPKGKR